MADDAAAAANLAAVTAALAAAFTASEDPECTLESAVCIGASGGDCGRNPMVEGESSAKPGVLVVMEAEDKGKDTSDLPKLLLSLLLFPLSVDVQTGLDVSRIVI